MLLVVGPAHAAGQLQIVGDVVIGLAEPRIGIQRIGILAEEIIVTLIVEAGDRIGIDIDAVLQSARRRRRSGLGA